MSAQTMEYENIRHAYRFKKLYVVWNDNFWTVDGRNDVNETLTFPICL